MFKVLLPFDVLRKRHVHNLDPLTTLYCAEHCRYRQLKSVNPYAYRHGFHYSHNRHRSVSQVLPACSMGSGWNTGLLSLGETAASCRAAKTGASSDQCFRMACSIAIAQALISQYCVPPCSSSWLGELSGRVRRAWKRWTGYGRHQVSRALQQKVQWSNVFKQGSGVFLATALQDLDLPVVRSACLR